MLAVTQAFQTKIVLLDRPGTGRPGARGPLEPDGPGQDRQHCPALRILRKLRDGRHSLPFAFNPRAISGQAASRGLRGDRIVSLQPAKQRYSNSPYLLIKTVLNKVARAMYSKTVRASQAK